MSAWILFARALVRRALLPILLLFVFGCATNQGKVKPPEPNSKQRSEDDIPKLTRPSVRRIWIPPQVKENGTIYEEGYWRYLIDKESVWSR